MAKRFEVRALRGLCAIVDPDLCRVAAPVEVARAILRGGCAALQLRDKRADEAVREALARELVATCREARVPFYVNDFPELALLVGADGVHLGQADMPVSEARRSWVRTQRSVSPRTISRRRSGRHAPERT